MLIDPTSFKFQSPSGFLVIDGVNGGGKSTLQKKIVQVVQNQGHSVIATREPGATGIGRQIRAIALESEIPPTPLCESFLFVADRAEHVASVIKPALTRGDFVVCDRYYYSTLAFQGYGRMLDLELLKGLNAIAIQNTVPDLVVILDLSAEEGLRRAARRDAQERDLFEEEQLDFHQRLRNGFLELATTCPEPFLIIDANQTADQVFAELTPILDLWIASR